VDKPLAVCARTMCWQEVPTGVFDSDRAKKVAENLLAYIESSVITQIREEIAREIRGEEIKEIMILALRAQFTGHGWTEDYQIGKANKLWMILSDRISAAIARGEK